MIRATIDEKEIEVPEGTLIIEAARKLGIEIPTYCYHGKLLPYGGCRLCLVEVEKMPKLQTACSTYVCPGMIIHTNTEQVKKARKAMLEFLLINHPLDCPVCDQAGECLLQDYVYKYGPYESRFAEEKRRFPRRFLSPWIEKDANRCIHCMRCVRYCREIMGVGALGVFERGYSSEIGPFAHKALDCVHCGNCMEICPVGALTSKPFRFKSRIWELKEVSTICPYCSCGCSITLGIKQGKVIRSKSIENMGINNEFLCIRGRFGYSYLHHPERIKVPLVKSNGGFREISWDEAIKFTATNLQDIINTYGGEAIGVIGSPGNTNEECYIFNKLSRTVLKTNNVDNRLIGSIATDASDFAGYFSPEQNLLDDINKANTIFIFGASILEELPFISAMILERMQREELNLIIASPRKGRLDKSATRSFIYKFGNEKEFLDENEIELKESLSRGKSIILMGSKMSNRLDSLEILSKLKDFARQIPELRIYNLFEFCNSKGAVRMGLTPGFFANPGKEKFFEDKWGVSLAVIKGMNTHEILTSAVEGEIKALYIAGSDLLADYPDRSLVNKALDNVRFIIVQDILMTDTAKKANIILPGASFAEKEGTFTNIFGHEQYLKKAINPIGVAKDDIDIFCSLAKEMGSRLFEYSDINEIRKEINEVVKYSEIEEFGRMPDKLSFEGTSSSVDAQNSEEYPFILITGDTYFGLGTSTCWSDLLYMTEPDAYVEINPVDAENLKITEGEKVKIYSGKGVLNLKIRITDGLPIGVIFIPRNYYKDNVNILYDSSLPVSRVKIKKC